MMKLKYKVLLFSLLITVVANAQKHSSSKYNALRSVEGINGFWKHTPGWYYKFPMKSNRKYRKSKIRNYPLREQAIIEFMETRKKDKLMNRTTDSLKTVEERNMLNHTPNNIKSSEAEFIEKQLKKLDDLIDNIEKYNNKQKGKKSSQIEALLFDSKLQRAVFKKQLTQIKNSLMDNSKRNTLFKEVGDQIIKLQSDLMLTSTFLHFNYN